MRRTSLKAIALSTAMMLALSGCGISDAREAALKEANTKPLSSTNSWQPGLVALSDYTASGFGPAGYPNVDASAIFDDSGDQPLIAPQELLQSISLKSADLNNVEIALIENGDTLNRPTLEFCGATFASESLRVHRRQVAGTFNGTSWISSEAVIYKSPAAAQQAIDEMVAAKKACPDDTVYKNSVGEDVTINFFAAPGPNETVLVPAEQRVILNFTEKSSASGATPARSFLALQVRGNVLLAFYLVEDIETTFTQDGLDVLYGFVSALTKRLNALDPTEIGLK